MQVLDKGALEHIDCVASDLKVIAAARVSNGIDYESASKGEEGDYRLINYLIKHRHGTPFEHCFFTYYVDCPLFVAREWHRHRIASYNEVSRRYVDTRPKFYIPDHVRVPGTTSKQGSVLSEDNVLESYFIGGVRQTAEHCVAVYEDMLSQGVAKELARMVLPQNMYTQFYFSVNARALMNFISLRNAPDAQWEIRKYAELLELDFAKHMPLTHKAFVENGKIAP